MARSASAVIHDGKGKVLLGRRSLSKAFAPGLWETIGGQIEEGESALETLHREVAEELGGHVVLADVKFLGRYQFHSELGELESEVFTVRISGTPTPSPEDFEELRWVDQPEALALDFCVNCRERVVDFYAQIRT